MNVSIVVPAHNEAGNIQGVLQSLLDQRTRYARIVEIIVVASGRRPEAPIFAIRAGAAGDITGDSHWVAWQKQQRGPYMPTPLIYDGYEPGPGGCADTGAADRFPGSGGAVVKAVIDRNARAWIGVDRYVGNRPLRGALRHHAFLVRGLQFIGADAAAAAAPAGFADIRAGTAARGQGRAADGDDIRRAGRP